jgi:hypothetical protein
MFGRGIIWKYSPMFGDSSVIQVNHLVHVW